MNAAKRSCGNCTACCFTHAVTEVNTNAGEWCNKCSKNSCSIYAARPIACRVYECWWLKGKGEESDRPDLSGFVMDGMDIPGQSVGIVNLWEFVPGALNSRRALQIAQAIVDQGEVVGLHIAREKRSFARFPREMNDVERAKFIHAFQEFDRNLGKARGR